MNKKKVEVPWYWLSFTDSSGFLGGCYVQADGPPHPLFPENRDPFVLAVGKSHQLGINPGGRVAGAGPLTKRQMDKNVPLKLRNKLLSKSDLAKNGGFSKWPD